MNDEEDSATASRAGATGRLDPERWVEVYGDALFRFALMRLRDAARAEDAVQETFLAALKSGQFAGRSAEKSWLFGILKNKICDHFRKAGREISFTDMEGPEEGGPFEAEGKWKNGEAPREWENAGESLDSEAFWKAYRACLEKLPGKTATAFNLREVDGVESKEVCAMLNISENYLWVTLHRARMALRACLETNWFTKT
jgi:RNA polymerase sigma-70 factor (ECF subfamily)